MIFEFYFFGKKNKLSRKWKKLKFCTYLVVFAKRQEIENITIILYWVLCLNGITTFWYFFAVYFFPIWLEFDLSSCNGWVLLWGRREHLLKSISLRFVEFSIFMRKSWSFWAFFGFFKNICCENLNSYEKKLESKNILKGYSRIPGSWRVFSHLNWQSAIHLIKKNFNFIKLMEPLTKKEIFQRHNPNLETKKVVTNSHHFPKRINYDNYKSIISRSSSSEKYLIK